MLNSTKNLNFNSRNVISDSFRLGLTNSYFNLAKVAPSNEESIFIFILDMNSYYDKRVVNI